MASGVTKYALELQVNGHRQEVVVRGSDTMLHILREKLGLTGTKIGCENGDCGACTILVDGEPMHACLILGVEAAGCEITTIEGLRGAPIQQAFVKHDAFQCGYCTSGFLMNAHALTCSHPNATDEQVREWLQSNLCRCTSYREIEAAVQSVLGTSNSE